MGGGKAIPTLMPTCAIAEIGAAIASAKRIVHRTDFFILLPPLSVNSGLLFRLDAGGQDHDPTIAPLVSPL